MGILEVKEKVLTHCSKCEKIGPVPKNEFDFLRGEDEDDADG
jgi:hypothetical protein